MTDLEVGAVVPDFKISRQGEPERYLRDLKGRPTILALFPPGWDPSFPRHFALYRELAQQLGVDEPVGLSADGEWCEVSVQERPSERVPLVDGSEAATALGVEGCLAVLVLDSEGKIAWSHVSSSASPPRADDLVAAVKGLMRRDQPSRRQVLAAAVAVSLVLALLPKLSEAKGGTAAVEGHKDPLGRPITLRVNGADHRVSVDPRTTVLDALRERLGLTGTKKGCDHGQCGACTVLLDGKRANSCMVLAMQAEGQEITTVEGLAKGDQLHPVQEAFIKHDGFQCGYCTPGQIMSAVACIQEGHATSDDQIREFMSGNICRCGAYNGILDAVKEARSAMGSSK